MIFFRNPLQPLTESKTTMVTGNTLYLSQPNQLQTTIYHTEGLNSVYVQELLG